MIATSGVFSQKDFVRRLDSSPSAKHAGAKDRIPSYEPHMDPRTVQFLMEERIFWQLRQLRTSPSQRQQVQISRHPPAAPAGPLADTNGIHDFDSAAPMYSSPTTSPLTPYWQWTETTSACPGFRSFCNAR